MQNDQESHDIGDIAIALAFRAIGYFVLANIAMMVVVALSRTFGAGNMSDSVYWGCVWGVWFLLTAEVVRRVAKLKKSEAKITNTQSGLHMFEILISGFLGLYALARPYLIEGDASGYPYVTAMFQILIGIMALFHVLLIVIFKTKIRTKDIATLTFCLTVGVLAAIR